MKRLGYARLSTIGQTIEAQLEQLEAAGCSTMYRRGAQTKRKEVGRLLMALQKGDILVVTRIDRLARSTFELFAIVKNVVEAGGNFYSSQGHWRTHRRAPAA